MGLVGLSDLGRGELLLVISVQGIVVVACLLCGFLSTILWPHKSHLFLQPGLTASPCQCTQPSSPIFISNTPSLTAPNNSFSISFILHYNTSPFPLPSTLLHEILSGTTSGCGAVRNSILTIWLLFFLLSGLAQIHMDFLLSLASVSQHGIYLSGGP